MDATLATAAAAAAAAAAAVGQMRVRIEDTICGNDLFLSVNTRPL